MYVSTQHQCLSPRFIQAGVYSGSENLLHPWFRSEGKKGKTLKIRVTPASSDSHEPVCAQSCLTHCDPTDCRLPACSVHGILQPRTLEWVAISFSRGSSRPGTKPESPALQADSSALSRLGSPSVSLTPHNDPPAEPLGSTLTVLTTRPLSPLLCSQPPTPAAPLPDGFLQLPPTWAPASLSALTSGSWGHSNEHNCQKHEFHW